MSADVGDAPGVEIRGAVAGLHADSHWPFATVMRAVALLLLGVGCMVVACSQAVGAIAGAVDPQSSVTFLLTLSVMPVPALVGYALAGAPHTGESPAPIGMLLGVVAWLLLYVALVTYTVVPAAICALGGIGFGLYALIRYRAFAAGWWSVAMNVCLLAGAVYVASAYIEHAIG